MSQITHVFLRSYKFFFENTNDFLSFKTTTITEKRKKRKEKVKKEKLNLNFVTGNVMVLKT